MDSNRDQRGRGGRGRGRGSNAQGRGGGDPSGGQGRGRGWRDQPRGGQSGAQPNRSEGGQGGEWRDQAGRDQPGGSQGGAQRNQPEGGQGRGWQTTTEQSQDSRPHGQGGRGHNPLSRRRGTAFSGTAGQGGGGAWGARPGPTAPASPPPSTSAWTTEPSKQAPEPKPSTSASVVEEKMRELTVEAAGPSDPKPKETTEEKETASGETTSKSKRRGKGRGKAKVEGEPAKTDEPKPSTSAAPAAGAPTKPVVVEVNPVYQNIPRRQKEGMIHAGSKFFEPRTTRIEVNYLPIEFSDVKMKVFHYDIEFPQNANKDIARTLLQKMKTKYFPTRHPAYDGAKNLYAARTPLFLENRVTDTISIARENGKDREFTITIKRAAENVELTISTLYTYIRELGCSMNRPQSTIQAVEVAIRGNLPERFVSTGRAFYTKPSRYTELSAGLELYSGFIQGAVLGENKAFVNVDVSHRGFYTAQPLMQYLENVLRDNAGGDFSQFDNGLTANVERILDEYVRQNNGLKMRYKDPRTNAVRVYRMKGVTIRRNAKTAMFELTEGNSVRRVSVYDYFLKAKQFTIQYPLLPVIVAGSKQDLFPMECCTIEERQPVQNQYKYSPPETRQMIANCKDLPDGRKSKILNSIQTADFNSDPVLREFGITVGDRGNTRSLLQVEAASLRSPTVYYKDGTGEVQNGVWKFKRFTDTVNVTNWILVNMNHNTRVEEVQKLEHLLMQNAGAVGMGMSRSAITNPYPMWSRFDEPFLDKSISDLKRKCPNLQLVVVILPKYNEDVAYRRVKYVSEIKIGLLTQCVKPDTARKVSWMTAQNLLVKINSKMSGASHFMGYPAGGPALFDGSYMFVGADVTHPAPGPNQKNERSISAVAGSYDKTASKYKMFYCIQESREEMIQSMERMIQALLMFFAKNNGGKYPAKLYYYRDGVSDGQFAMVLNTEMGAIHSAIRKLKADIKVMFLVVQKRHHTRFFPPRSFADRKGNVNAGTVVNNTITHPSEHDFYLVSHQSIQGTARPTKYHVLYDEIGASEDYVEALTYYLCYMFVRCSRSVSYPAPTYYAHLAAARAERYVKCVKESNTVNLERDLSAGPLGEGTIHNDMRDRNPMYFV